jgi:hypothetical protein
LAIAQSATYRRTDLVIVKVVQVVAFAENTHKNDLVIVKVEQVVAFAENTHKNDLVIVKSGASGGFRRKHT